MKRIISVTVTLFLILLSGGVGAVIVSYGETVVYDPNDPPELVGELGPDLYWAGFTFTDPLHGFLITINVPLDLPSAVDYGVTSGPNGTGLPYAGETILPGESETIVIGLALQASQSNPFNIYFAMAAYDLEESIPFGGDSGTGIIAPQVPVPAAVWLFGTGLIALIGVARRKVRV